MTVDVAGSSEAAGTTNPQISYKPQGLSPHGYAVAFRRQARLSVRRHGEQLVVSNAVAKGSGATYLDALLAFEAARAAEPDAD